MEDDVVTKSFYESQTSISSYFVRSGVPIIFRIVLGVFAILLIADYFAYGNNERSCLSSFSSEQPPPGLASQHSHALALLEDLPLSSTNQSQAFDSHNCARSCGIVDVPYPFGLSAECARGPYFQLQCLENNETEIDNLGSPRIDIDPGPWPYLTTANGSYTDYNSTIHMVTSFQVLNLTSQTVIINTTAIKAMSCLHGSDSYANATYGSASIILPPDGPFRASTSNVFFVSGCESIGKYSAYDATTEFAPTCGPNGCNNLHTYPYCNDYDCCSLSIPAMTNIYMVGLGLLYSDQQSCGFSSVLLPSTYNTINPGDIGVGTYGLELEWLLELTPNESYANCSTLASIPGYACSSQANCQYVTFDFKRGYVCECALAGFKGDGYINGTGCNDIDECKNPALNQCSPDAKCTNTIGSYNCNCTNPLMEGDGFLNGTRCTYIDFCAAGGKNDCAQGATCGSMDHGRYNCTCSGGLVGDGRVHGTGCKSDSKAPLIISMSVGAILVFLVLNALVVWFLYRKGKKKGWLGGIFGPADFSRRDFLMEIQSKEGANICRLFTYAELEQATDGFSADRVLGSGGFGTVFEGVLSDGTKVAIKKSKHDVGEGRDDTQQFINEVTILSQVNHRNLVKLLGCCLETRVPVLVYEFIPNGSLSDHLSPLVELSKGGEMVHSCRQPLYWNDRLNIAIGTAEGLSYLHSGTSPPIYHRDVKSANILLDKKNVPKVADFGLSKFVPLEATHLSTAIQGTPGYLDPEYFANYQITDKSDVYSFGIVLLELITAEKPVDLTRQIKDHNLAIRCTRIVKQGRLEDIIDQTLDISKDPQILESIHAVAQLAVKCVERYREDRPSMREVLEELETIARLTRKHALVAPGNPGLNKPRLSKHVRFGEDLLDGMSLELGGLYDSCNELPSKDSGSAESAIDELPLMLDSSSSVNSSAMGTHGMEIILLR